MNRLKLFFLDKGFIRLTLRNVSWWTEKKKISFLEYAVKNGIHTIRREAVLGLGLLNSESSIPLLIATIDDPFRDVSKAAIKVLETMSPPEELLIILNRKKEFWKKNYTPVSMKKGLSVSDLKKQRGSKQTLQNVKELLRKPINIGKWF